MFGAQIRALSPLDPPPPSRSIFRHPIPAASEKKAADVQEISRILCADFLVIQTRHPHKLLTSYETILTYVRTQMIKTKRYVFMHVLLIGAGIAGLTAAIALRKKGIDVTVLEQARQLSEIGAGI